MSETTEQKEPAAEPKPENGSASTGHLGLWDTVSVIIGIVIGSSIYKTPPLIFSNVSGSLIGLGAWVLGGVLSLVGALVYAELASTYSQRGGDYVYLTRGLGPWAGFLFGWGQLSVVRSGNVGMMAFVFAEYALKVWALPTWLSLEEQAVVLAVGAVVVVAVVNLLGVHVGKTTQNVLTACKVVGLGGIVVAGFFFGTHPKVMTETAPVQGPGFGLAMILVLFAFGGWNDAAFVAAELRERRNVVRALILGIAGISLIYLLVNLAYLFGLGFTGVRDSKEVAANVFELALGGSGAKAMSLLVMISALGAVNGMIYTGSRVYASMGADHKVFAALGRWHPRLGSPHWAMLAQTGFTLLMIGIVGTTAGRDAINRIVTFLGNKPPSWQDYNDGFDKLLATTAPVFWAFFFLTGVSYFILRIRDRGLERPFALHFPWYPLLPLAFCGTCLFMLYSAVDYAKHLTWIGVVPVLLGLPLYLYSGRSAAAAATEDLAAAPE